MLHAMTLSLALVLSSAPVDLGPAPAVEEPAPVQCADAALAQATAPLFAALGDFGALSVTCTVDCDGNGSEETGCTGASCIGVERNCSIGERGYVTCDGITTFCPICEPECEEGTIQLTPTGQCCNCYTTGGEETYREKCINGQWEVQSVSCRPSSSCPPCQ